MIFCGCWLGKKSAVFENLVMSGGIPWCQVGVRGVPSRVVEAPKKKRQKRRLVQVPQVPFKAPIHSKCCIGGFRETGLALVIVLRCDWPLCDIWFKSYEHFKIKMFLSVHTAGPWWIFQPKFYTFCVKSVPLKKAPGKKAAPWRLLGACAPFLTLAP